MSSTANYAATPAIGSGTTTTADTSYTAPTNSTVGVIATAPSTGLRIDRLSNVTQGTSIASIMRFWVCEGTVGPTISSITSVTTTATVTTATAHNLITGDLITMSDCYPLEYNVKSVAVTVTGANTFTYTITSVSSVAASTLGWYSATRAAANYHLVKEMPVLPVTGSTTAAAYAFQMDSSSAPDILPLMLPPGWSLRTTVAVTQTNAMKTTAFGGKF